MVRWLLVIAGAGAAESCSDALPPKITGTSDFPFVISEPVLATAAGSVATLSAPAVTQEGGGDGYVFVSLPAGTLADGRSATVRNLANGFLVTADMADGGLDPVLVLAGFGDSVEIVIVDVGGGQLFAARSVPLRTPPVVVRTVPPRGGTDVPLNALIRIVFSEPMDPRTITSRSLQLTRAGVVVAGRVTLSADGLRADYVPDSLLAPVTDYVLSLAAAADRSGDSLEAPLVAVFMTVNAVTPQPPASVTVSPGAASLVPGAITTFRAAVLDALGNEIAGEPIAWSSSAPSVASVVADGVDDARAVVSAASNGSATIRATAAGVTGIASVTVATPPPPPSVRLWMPDTVRTTVPFSLRAQAIIRDSNGAEIFNVPVSAWSVSDPNQAVQLGSSQLENGRNEVALSDRGILGAARITARSGTDSASTVMILDSLTLRAATVGLGTSGVDQCYLDLDGRAWCHGGLEAARGTPGVLGAQAPVAVATNVRFTAISKGVWHTCALAPGGAAYCWGSNASGEVGAPSGTPTDVPTQVAGGLSFRQLSVGTAHSCGLATNGLAYCWGRQLSVEDAPWFAAGPTDHVPSPVGGGTFSTISAGDQHTCALTTAGAAFCWGANAFGQLGDSSFLHRAAPVAVAGGHTFVHISAGRSHTCAVSAAGEAWCWGTEGDGWGYTGTLPASNVPRKVALPAGVTLTSISVGIGPTCAVASDGNAYCWGYRWHSDETATGEPPTLVPGGLHFESVSSGFAGSCGFAQGAVYCWGTTIAGQWPGQPGRVESQR